MPVMAMTTSSGTALTKWKMAYVVGSEYCDGMEARASSRSRRRRGKAQGVRRSFCSAMRNISQSPSKNLALSLAGGCMEDGFVETRA